MMGIPREISSGQVECKSVKVGCEGLDSDEWKNFLAEEDEGL